MSFLLFTSGTGALLACDLLVTRFLSPEDIVLWAEVRALIGLLGVLAAGGLDLVFVRSPQSSIRLLRLCLIQIPLVALPLGVMVHMLGYLSGWLPAATLAAGSAGVLVLSQFYRAHHRYLASQLAQQAWKIGALILLVGLLWQLQLPKPDVSVSVLLLLSSGIAAGHVYRVLPELATGQAPQPVRELYGIGLRFMATSLILAISVYGEQLLVSGVGSVRDAALFFTHATYFLFPVSVLNGYLAFRIGPWLRDNHDRFVAIQRGRWLMILLSATVYAAIMHGVGWLVWHLVSPAIGAPDPVLQLLLLASALARTLYTLPSGYNGVFGRPREHDILIAAQVILLAVVALSVYLALGTMPFVYLVACAGALNWIARTAVGFVISLLIIARSKHQDARY
ncbi:MAG: hypothetical protein ACK4P8_09915 [Tabrizicola sp.]